MSWDIYKAKSWMLRVGMDYIEAELFAEGGELVYEAKWGFGCNSELDFRETIKDICCWDEDEIDGAVQEILK
jgi:hypothetical protein